MADEPRAEELNVQPMEFKAEVQQLLRILSHSLYKERDIFLRELLSNASDALHRAQFTMLMNQDVLDAGAELAIHIEADKEANTLTVSDTGIGMTREELVENLGTIAHSGAMAFLQTLEEGKKLDDIIGQFGVGFYAVFMVSDEVRVTSRSYQPDAQAWTWVSRGDSTYHLRPAEKEHRGTTIEIQLKDDAKEYTSTWRLEQIVKTHSNYVSFPIYVGETVANQQTAIWRQSPSQVIEDDYNSFYRQLTMDVKDPLLHVHIVSDVPVEIHSVLYVPADRDTGLFRSRPDYGLKLYSRKVLIQEHNKDLLRNICVSSRGSWTLPMSHSTWRARPCSPTARSGTSSVRCVAGCSRRCRTWARRSLRSTGVSGSTGALHQGRVSPRTLPGVMIYCRCCGFRRPSPMASLSRFPLTSSG